jgi:hypothetical protein
MWNYFIETYFKYQWNKLWSEIGWWLGIDLGDEEKKKKKDNKKAK